MAFEQDWRQNPRYQQGMAQYAPLVSEAIAAYGLPPEAADYIQGTLGVESRWGQAKGLDQPGAAGELGIAQLTPGFRQQYGVTNALDPRQSINAIARYYSEQYKKGAPLEYIPIGYNAGTSRLNKFLSGERSFESLPQITQNYVNRLRQFTGKSSTMPSSGLAGYSTPVANTMAQYNLPTSRQPQQTMSLADALYGQNSTGATPLGQALYGEGGIGRTPIRGSTQMPIANDTELLMPMAGQFTSTLEATPESIARLLQGV